MSDNKLEERPTNLLTCYIHQENSAIGACVGCGKFICSGCCTTAKSKNYCKSCVDEVFNENEKKIEKIESKNQNNFPYVFMKKTVEISVISSILVGILFFLSSQYFPIFGTLEKFGAPFSPARLSLIPVHIITGILIGFFVPFVILMLMKISNSSNIINSNDSDETLNDLNKNDSLVVKFKNFTKTLPLKKIFIVFSICVVTFVTGLYAYKIVFDPVKLYITAINNNDGVHSNELYSNKIKGNPENEAKVKEQFAKQSLEIENEFKNGKLDFENANKKLLSIMGSILSPKEVDITFSNVTKLNDSHVSYTKGIEFRKTNKLIESILEFNKVLPEDINYSASQNNINEIKPILKTETLKQIDEKAQSQKYDEILKMIMSIQDILPNDDTFKENKVKYEKLNAEKKALEYQLNIEKLQKEQQLQVQNTSIYVQDEQYKSLYPDQLRALVKNMTNKTVKSFKIAFLAYDINGYPVTFGFKNSFSEPSYLGIANASNVNLLAGETFGTISGWNLDYPHHINKVLACVKSAEFFEGNTWVNEYYDHWLKENKEKVLKLTDISTSSNTQTISPATNVSTTTSIDSEKQTEETDLSPDDAIKLVKKKFPGTTCNYYSEKDSMSEDGYRYYFECVTGTSPAFGIYVDRYTGQLYYSSLYGIGSKIE